MDASPTASPRERTPWVFHPLLLAAFPSLSLFSTNTGIASLPEIVAPLILCVGIVAILYALLRVAVPNRHKLGAAVSVGIALFFTYGAILDAVRRWLRFREMLTGGTMLLIVAVGTLTAVALLVWLYRTSRSFVPVTRFLNRVALAAVLIAAGTAAYGKTKVAAYHAPDALAAPAITLGTKEAPKDPPDIYFIVLDSYARADLLKSFFGYDNEPFLNQLRERGFFVADQSVSNYGYTRLCLASTLNLNYVDPAFIVPVHKLQGETLPISGMIRHNAVTAFLKSHGYTFIAFGSGASGTEIPGADVYLKPRFGITEFSKALINLTPIRSILNRSSYRLDLAMMRDRIVYMLDTLPHLHKERSPIFVFAHLMAPHSPHVFDAEGKVLRVVNDADMAGLNDEDTAPTRQETEAPVDPQYQRLVEDVKKGYRDEVTYLNRRVIEVVDAILKENPNSVFIIQGDHGPRMSISFNKVFDLDAHIADYTHILNTYYLPGVDANAVLTRDITPVNSFRVVLNAYFGTELPMLESQSHLTAPDDIERVITIPAGAGQKGETP